MRKILAFDQSKCFIENYFKDGRNILHSYGNNMNIMKLRVSPSLTDPILHMHRKK